MKQIDVADLKEKFEKSEDFILLDVRENEELNIAKIDPHIHIPMGEIKKRYDELKKNKPIVVMCHGGFRSAKVCSFLNNLGFNVTNLSGGIDSWSHNIDPSIKKY